MKLELTMSRPAWAFAVRVSRASTGDLYAHLIGAEGKVGAILTTKLISLDAIVNDSDALYAELLKKYADTFSQRVASTFRPNTARNNSSLTKPTTAKGPKKPAAAVSTAASAGA